MSNNDNQQEVRREKLARLSTHVSLYPNDFRVNTTTYEIRENYAHLNDEQLAELSVSFEIAGRIILHRSFGKLTFATLQDMYGTVQIAVKRDEVGAELYNNVFKCIDLGDIIGVSGSLFRTKTKELTIRVRDFKVLTKSLHPLPDKHKGLSDKETCYRQRYLDLMVNEETRSLFTKRSQIIQNIRAYMVNNGFLEVETPMMHPIPGGATARPFVTHHNALDMDLFLRIAPELYLKKLVVGGLDRVFEINRNFRNEGLSTRHNPEFTTMEFYWAYHTYEDLMDFINQMFATFSYQMKFDVEWNKTFERMTLKESLVKYAGVNSQHVDDLEFLREFAEVKEISIPSDADLGKAQLELFEKIVESQLIEPTFITEYPTSVSPLARRNDNNPEIADRFELFINGVEIANGFSELNDPVDQSERFRQQAENHASGDVEAMHYDADYINALEYGLPPTAGAGIGIDRVVVLLTNSSSIRDVILFPQLKE